MSNIVGGHAKQKATLHSAQSIMEKKKTVSYFLQKKKKKKKKSNLNCWFNRFKLWNKAQKQLDFSFWIQATQRAWICAAPL